MCRPQMHSVQRVQASMIVRLASPCVRTAMATPWNRALALRNFFAVRSAKRAIATWIAREDCFACARTRRALFARRAVTRRRRARRTRRSKASASSARVRDSDLKRNERDSHLAVIGADCVKKPQCAYEAIPAACEPFGSMFANCYACLFGIPASKYEWCTASCVTSIRDYVEKCRKFLSATSACNQQNLDRFQEQLDDAEAQVGDAHLLSAPLRSLAVIVTLAAVVSRYQQ